MGHLGFINGQPAIQPHLPSFDKRQEHEMQSHVRSRSARQRDLYLRFPIVIGAIAQYMEEHSRGRHHSGDYRGGGEYFLLVVWQ